MNMDKQYRYFIAYIHQTGYGNSEVIRTTPISNMADIMEVQRSIVKDVQEQEGVVLKGVSITNFQPFEDRNV